MAASSLASPGQQRTVRTDLASPDDEHPGAGSAAASRRVVGAAHAEKLA